jgi:hypothetical protein
MRNVCRMCFVRTQTWQSYQYICKTRNAKLIAAALPMFQVTRTQGPAVALSLRTLIRVTFVFKVWPRQVR